MRVGVELQSKEKGRCEPRGDEGRDGRKKRKKAKKGKVGGVRAGVGDADSFLFCAVFRSFRQSFRVAAGTKPSRPLAFGPAMLLA
jgi:hypothetical protein